MSDPALPMAGTSRIAKYLADCGVASRRACEDIVRAGRVAVDGTVVVDLATRVPEHATVTVDQRPVHRVIGHTYLALNKPVGVVSTARDEAGRRTVLDLVATDRRLYPVGRLDYDSEGLVLLTDDGDLTLRLTHPRYGIIKEYHALIAGTLTPDRLAALRSGVMLDGVVTNRADVVALGRDRDGTWVRFRISEGRNRQIRRMCEAVGLEVVGLTRVGLGTLVLGTLRPGESRPLSRPEVVALRRLVGLPAQGSP